MLLGFGPVVVAAVIPDTWRAYCLLDRSSLFVVSRMAIGAAFVFCVSFVMF